MKQLFFFFFVSLSIFTCYPEGTIHIIINVKSANYRKPQKKKKRWRAVSSFTTRVAAAPSRKRNEMECKNGKDAPPFLAHALILSGQALETGLKPRYHNKQRQRAVNNHPSWDRNQKYKPQIELKNFR